MEIAPKEFDQEYLANIKLLAYQTCPEGPCPSESLYASIMREIEPVEPGWKPIYRPELDELDVRRTDTFTREEIEDTATLEKKKEEENAL